MKTYHIKNWQAFQHFKDRTPPWIKLYRSILDDREWHKLDPAAAKALIMLWLIASEDKAHNGALPDVQTMAFRLRTTEDKIRQFLSHLCHWVGSSDIDAISPRYHGDTPETETETETETEGECERVPGRRSVRAKAPTTDFDAFWSAYPRKVGKDAARKAYARRQAEMPAIPDLLAIVAAHARTPGWQKDGGAFIPHPATWINQGRWQDDLQSAPADAAQAAVDARKAAAQAALERIYARRKSEQTQEGVC